MTVMSTFSTEERNGVKIRAMGTAAHHRDSIETARANRPDLPDAPVARVVESVDGTLHTHPRKATPCTPAYDDRRRASRNDAPVPEEHVETDEEPVSFHPLWIPRTSTLRYVNGQSALNLRSRQIGGPGDWHGSFWWCPVDGVPWECHFAFVSDAGPYAGRTLEFARWMGEEELVDAREALVACRHPAAERNETVHCATHVRAIIEKAWGRLAAAPRRQGVRSLLSTLDPTTIARWIRAERDWLRLHALAKRVRDELITRPDEREIWEAWRVRQCPEGFWMRPEARWTGD